MTVKTLMLGRLMTNCYIVTDDETKTAAVIDPADDCAAILTALERANAKAEMILLTHGHFDHIMALDELRKQLNVPVYIHGGDERFLTDPELSGVKMVTGRNTVFGKAEKILAGGERIKLGSTAIDVLHTPGHTEGSVCYIAGSCLFSGDTLFENNVGRCDLYGGNREKLIDSMRTLFALVGSYTVYPGHGASTTLNDERKNNIFLREPERI